MPTEWKNRRVKPGPSKPTTLRIKADLLARLTKIADQNNTTKTAIIDYAIEKFLEDHDAPKKAKAPLFD